VKYSNWTECLFVVCSRPNTQETIHRGADVRLSLHTVHGLIHLAPILGPVLDHMHFIRLEKSWLLITGPAAATEMCRPLFTTDCDAAAAALASRGREDWFSSYYARSGLFVGDLDHPVTAEEAVDKGRVEISRTFSDLLQTALALKGDWALVLANNAREEQANCAKNDNLLKFQGGPRNRFSEGQVNADGTPKSINQAAIDARKLRRISAVCHFLFSSNYSHLPSNLILEEAVACHPPRYAELLGSRMMSAAVKNMLGTIYHQVSVPPAFVDSKPAFDLTIVGEDLEWKLYRSASLFLLQSLQWTATTR
jgi:hypothetical protein